MRPIEIFLKFSCQTPVIKVLSIQSKEYMYVELPLSRVPGIDGKSVRMYFHCPYCGRRTCAISQSRLICGGKSTKNLCRSSGRFKRIMNFGLVCLRFVMPKTLRKWRYGRLIACDNKYRVALPPKQKSIL